MVAKVHLARVRHSGVRVCGDMAVQQTEDKLTAAFEFDFEITFNGFKV